MMKLRYLFENFELAKLALARYPHDEDSLDECLHWFRISANAVYPYRHQGKLCFLQLAPVEEKQLSLDALGEITDENGEAQFMAGYRSAAPFTQEMESQRPLMRRMIRLRSYARLLYCLNDQIDNQPEWMTELCAKLNRAKERLEREI